MHITNNIDIFRTTYPYIWWDDVFTQEELSNIENYCSFLDKDEGKVRGIHNLGVNKDYRKSDVSFLMLDNDNEWIFHRLNNLIDHANQKYYNFDLVGYTGIQYSEYDGNQLGKYDHHIDMAMGEEIQSNRFLTRKLSLTLLLNEPKVDFQGGDFEILLTTGTDPIIPEMKKGRIILFPSWIMHGVKEVTSGVRKSLVIWVQGPKFR